MPCLLADVEHKMAKVYHLVEGRYLKQADVAGKTLDFDLGPCRIELDFSTIRPPAPSQAS